MNLPPYLIDMRIRSAAGRPFRLWLPLFLLWPLLLLLGVLGICGTLLADAILFAVGQRYHHYTLLLAGVFELLSETRGLVVRVHSDETFVDMTFV